jgi:hypothetical protein
MRLIYKQSMRKAGLVSPSKDESVKMRRPHIGGIARENKMKPLSKLLDTVAVVNEWLTESQSFQPSVPRTVDFTFKSQHSKC